MLQLQNKKNVRNPSSLTRGFYRRYDTELPCYVSFAVCYILYRKLLILGIHASSLTRGFLGEYMIVILKSPVSDGDLQDFLQMLTKRGLGTHVSQGENTTLVGLVGDTAGMNEKSLEAHHLVSRVMRVQEPYKMANRKFHPDDTFIHTGADKKSTPFTIGGNSFAVMAGPCSVESEEQLTEIGISIKKSGAQFLRGGAFKPRTSPYAFQGLGADGIVLMEKVKKATGLPIVSEIMSIKHIESFENVDIIQIGARNMQNFELLKELGTSGKPILLKRGLSATIKEFLMSAEYLMAAGNSEIILCERGIRTFDNYTRNTLDVSAVPFLKKESHLPVIIDPSHACGLSWMVEPLAKAAIAVGANGVMIEVHNNPECALSDGEQSVTPQQFDDIMKKIKAYVQIEDKVL